VKFTSSLAFYIKRGDEANRKYSAIKFVNMASKQSETFYHMNLKVVSFWASLLANYINQIGVQEYFRTVRMLGKGVSAEVYLSERISDGKQFAIKVFNKLKNNKKCQVRSKPT
jgi:serine/threonine protein kinase